MSLTAKQLEERKLYIGGSDVGSILGYNSFNSAIDVFNAKIDGKESISNTQMYWGNVLEPVIRNEFDSLLQHYTDLYIRSPDNTKYHKNYNFLAGNVDGLICQQGNSFDSSRCSHRSSSRRSRLRAGPVHRK